MAVAALFGALALFWLSTRQFPTLWRLLVWILGLALLGLAASPLVTDQSRFGLVQLFGDAYEHRGNLNEAALIRALQLNFASIATFLEQLLDLFVVAVAALAILTLLAFTRGERLEQGLRPVIIGMFAFIAGCVATLCVVAIGFGDYVKPRTYSHGAVEETNIHDGDTFRIGEASLRLYGVDAPEAHQTCRGLNRSDCGAMAREQLVSLLSDGPIQCDQMLSRVSQRPRDSFGRALVRCKVSRSGATIDVGEELIRSGMAVQFEGDDYGYAAAEREGISQGLMAGCTLRPDSWRNGEARIAFERDGSIVEGAETMGHCSPRVIGAGDEEAPADDSGEEPQ